MNIYDEVNKIFELACAIDPKQKKRFVSEPIEVCHRCESTDINYDPDMRRLWCNSCNDFAEPLWDKWDWQENDRMNER
jgi:hypothetical protein